MMIGFWLLLLIPIALLLFRDWEFSNPNSRYTGRPDPLDILRERYARGEIDAEEFRIRKQQLQSL